MSGESIPTPAVSTLKQHIIDLRSRLPLHAAAKTSNAQRQTLCPSANAQWRVRVSAILNKTFAVFDVSRADAIVMRYTHNPIAWKIHNAQDALPAPGSSDYRNIVVDLITEYIDITLMLRAPVSIVVAP